MKNNRPKETMIKKGNLTVPDKNEIITPKYLNYSVTRHDLLSPDESNIPVPDEENVIDSKKFVDQNHMED